MQSLPWYFRRLQKMSPGEIGWRARHAVRNAVGRCNYSFGSMGNAAVKTREWPAGNSLLHCPVPVAAWHGAPAASPEARWTHNLTRHADDLLSHRFSFLNLTRVDLGTRIDWNRDHETGTSTPLRFAPSIDYRDRQVAGDAKLVWELNRHLHLPVLGRAYRATGDWRYAQETCAQLESWIEQCPPGVGMNWRSPLELAIRAINWVWTISLIEPSGLIGGAFRDRLLSVLDQHVREIAGKYSRGSSANNHRIGEAAGVFIATSCLPHLSDATRRREESRDILVHEILAQTYLDGGTREQAFGYHLFVLHFYLLAGLVATRTGQPLPAQLWRRLSLMIDYAEALNAAGAAPMFGDSDDGYVLDLGGRDGGGLELIAVGRALIDSSRAQRDCEPVRWLFGAPAFTDPSSTLSSPAMLQPRALHASGIYLLQWGRQDELNHGRATFDCGELGFGAIAAHGHADALSFTLRAFGSDIFVDPGTYDYFLYPEWRDYFRGTRAHNTLEVDHLDQSVMLGPFMWGDRANASCLEWTSDSRRSKVTGTHDGYARLPDPVIHRRTLEFDYQQRRLEILDEVVMREEHHLALHFHLAEHAKLTRGAANVFEIRVTGGTALLTVEPGLAVEVLQGREHPIAGWVSRSYHQKSPTITLRACKRARGNVAIRSHIDLFPDERTQ